MLPGGMNDLPSPQGTGSTAALASRLGALAQVFVHQQREPWEWIAGFETRNRYAVVDERGAPVAWAAEQQKGALGFVLRQVLGHWRRFEIQVFDPARALALRVVHPFRWFFQRLEVLAPDGRRLGAIQQRFSIFTKSFDVEDPRGRPVLRVRSGVLRFWRFDFERNGRPVASVQKKWSGLLSEAFTDRDVFRLSFDAALGEEERLVLLAAALFVDLRYFERKQ